MRELVVEVTSVEVAHAVAGTNRFSVALRDVDEEAIRDEIGEAEDVRSPSDIMDELTIKDMLEYIGASECVQHFDTDIMEEFGDATFESYANDRGYKKFEEV